MIIKLKDFDENKKLKHQLFLAQPNHRIIRPITTASGETVEISMNNLGELSFDVPYETQSTSLLDVKGENEERWEMTNNPEATMVKEFMSIKLRLGSQEQWFYVDSISDKIDDNSKMSVIAYSLEGELKRKEKNGIEHTAINVSGFYSEILEGTSWNVGHISAGLDELYRAFDIDSADIYALAMTGAESFGLVLKWDTATRTLNIFEASETRVFRGLTVREDNFIDTLVRQRESEDVCTRLYVYGDEDLGIQHVNPTGQTYIEDFSLFMAPFERDENKNVLKHSDYMSDELVHALLDNKILQDKYLPQIKQLQKDIDEALDLYSRALINQTERQGEMMTLLSLLDIAKATSDKPLIAKREKEVEAKQIEVDTINAEVKRLEKLVADKTAEIERIQHLIALTSFSPELLAELQPFIIIKTFTDDRYVDDMDLLEAGQKEFAKYSMIQQSYDISLFSFLEIAEASHMNDEIYLGEEIEIKSDTLKDNYRSIIYGLNYELSEGDVRVLVSDNMDDITSLDKLTTLLYNSSSVSNTVNSNRKKWNGIQDVRTEVDNIRDSEIRAVHNRILAGNNESIEIGNRGIILSNPDFKDEVVILQSGVIALSRDRGKTWNTSITPHGVIGDTIIGKILAGNNLIITNDSGSFTLDSNGLTVDMDSIFINSGTAENPENIVAKWNDLIITVSEFADDGLVNEYEKNQIKKNLSQINDVSASMIQVAKEAWGPETPENVYPKEYHDFSTKLKALNDYLKVTKQADGYAILDENRMDITSPVVPETFNLKHTDYEIAKEKFQAIIPLNFTASQIVQTKKEISLNYVGNGEIVTKLNVSEEGVKIDGKLLSINSKTEFNADLTMNAGVIKDKDGGIIIDLNKGTMTLNKPITIGSGSNLASKDDLLNIEMGYTALLTNDSAMVPTDFNGNNGIFATATTEFLVYQRTINDTENWTFKADIPKTVTANLTKNKLAVTAMTVDSAQVTLTGTKASSTSGQPANTISKVFNVTKVKAGVVGSDAVGYWVNVSDNVIIRAYDDTLKPTEITVSGFINRGTSDPESYAGRYIILTSVDGKIYKNDYISTTNQSTYTYKVPTDKTIKFIKVRFYQEGGVKYLLDEQTIPILTDIDGIEIEPRNMIQETAFNEDSQLWYFTSNSTATGVVTSIGDGEISIEGSNAEWKQWQIDTRDIKGGATAHAILESNKTYTITYEVFLSEGTTGTFNGMYRTNLLAGGSAQDYLTNSINASTIEKEKWVEISYNRTMGEIPDISEINFSRIMMVGTISGKIRFRKLRMNKGSVKMGWIPAIEDTRTYRAWANSLDGTQDFTRIEPEGNILLNSNFALVEDGDSGLNPGRYPVGWIGFNPSTETNAYHAYVNEKDFPENVVEYNESNGLRNWKGLRFSMTPESSSLDEIVSSQTKLYLTIDVRTDMLGTGKNRVFGGFHYLKKGATLWGFGDGYFDDIVPTKVNEWERFQVEVPLTRGGVDFDRGMNFYLYAYNFSNNATIWIKNARLSLDLAIPYVGAQDDSFSSSKMKYIGVGNQSSNNPLDYQWMLASDYVQAVTDDGLNSKAEQVDLDIIGEIANNANNLAEGAVQNEDYETWINSTYEEQVKNINNDIASANTDLANLDERTTLIDNQLGSMTEKWTFLDQSILFGEEGMKISHKSDNMSILIDSSRIAFYDNKTVVAYITAETLKINKGIFVDSAIIGNHMIMKYSNDSPVTIIKYVGNLGELA